MADLVRFVNTASTAGGNGTTNSSNPGDGNRAYATLAEAEGDLQQDLTDGGGDTMTIKCSAVADGGGSSDVVDTAAVVISGWTLSETNDLTIISHEDYRHDGKYANAGDAYVLQVTDTDPIRNDNEAYVTIEGLQIKIIFDSVETTFAVISAAVVTGNLTIVSKCILVADGGRLQYCLESNFSQTNLRAINTLMYGATTDVINANVTVLDVYNCTIHGGPGEDGIDAVAAATATVVNTICFNNNSDDFEDLDNIDYCATNDDYTGDGVGNLVISTADFTNNELTNIGAAIYTIKDVNAEIYLASETTQDDDPLVPDDDIVYATRNTGAGEQTSIGCFSLNEGAAPPVVGQVILITKAEREAVIKAAIPMMWACQGVNNRRDFMKHTSLAMFGL